MPGTPHELWLRRGPGRPDLAVHRAVGGVRCVLCPVDCGLRAAGCGLRRDCRGTQGQSGGCGATPCQDLGWKVSVRVRHVVSRRSPSQSPALAVYINA